MTRQLLKGPDKNALEELAKQGRADNKAIKKARCKTVCEGQFRMLNYVRNLPPLVIDEPPQLLGNDTAPNPGEAVLCALGSCLAVGIQANAAHRGINIYKLELELEGDINITQVWGVGDLEPKKHSFSDIAIKVRIDSDAPRETLEQLIAHSDKYSPVANTLRDMVPTKVYLADSDIQKHATN
jgi:uncharacterized OsmC-like protein